MIHLYHIVYSYVLHMEDNYHQFCTSKLAPFIQKLLILKTKLLDSTSEMKKSTKIETILAEKVIDAFNRLIQCPEYIGYNEQEPESVAENRYCLVESDDEFNIVDELFEDIDISEKDERNYTDKVDGDHKDDNKKDNDEIKCEEFDDTVKNLIKSSRIIMQSYRDSKAIPIVRIEYESSDESSDDSSDDSSADSSADSSDSSKESNDGDISEWSNSNSFSSKDLYRETLSLYGELMEHIDTNETEKIVNTQPENELTLENILLNDLTNQSSEGMWSYIN